ncbi:SEC12-like protein 1 isoform X1 [Dendrobium catenatum]|uniref:SEC12-like protein 1 n=1 Tax=Dendrobium catenatum TaxID=906689 RepID=A0A2I0WNN5_9ASPA|nr:SEC12-like protein 1 isoform X1 [Dendrobium catenatum]PKU77251.1 SEC12-like protein 1 [Dendrobium catenatum]
MEGGSESCASWIRRPENRVLVVVGKPKIGVSLPLLEVFSFDVKTASLSADPLVTCAMGEEDGDPVGFAVHPSGEEIVCSTAKGCKLFELCDRDLIFKLVAKDLPPLHSVGPQKCLAFSTDGSKFVTGGQDGHLRIIEWPSLKVLLDEPRAHKCFRDMDISLDSEFLVSTSTDGSARIWKINGAAPMISLTRNPDEKIECCRFSRDGMRPFLFCTVQKGGKVVTAVWDISTWNRIGFKRLLRKPISALSVSLDGKYLALGSSDGDICVVEVKKMEISHWSKKHHLGTAISSIEFCPLERIVISTSNQRGAVITKLNVPADWKEWQIYFLLLFLFLGSAVIFYLFHEHSDSFWNFPLGRNQPNRPYLRTLVQDSQLADDQSPW